MKTRLVTSLMAPISTLLKTYKVHLKVTEVIGKGLVPPIQIRTAIKYPNTIVIEASFVTTKKKKV